MIQPPRFWPVENYPDLVRDTDTGAILNKSSSGYQSYVKNHSRLKKEQERLEELTSDVSSLKSDIDVIKNLLINLLQEKKNDN
jgi:hypothetical protein